MNERNVGEAPVHLIVGASLVRAQHGVITWPQLLAAGVTPAAVRSQVARGQLYRLHRGVYAVSDPALLPLAAQSAALLALGSRAVLSHRTAAALWSLAPAGGPVDVTVTGNARNRDGLCIHRVGQLEPGDVATRERLRITTPARTVIDFAADARLSEVEYAISEGRALKLITDPKLIQALCRVPENHPGAATIRALLQAQIGRVITRSERERAMLRLLAAAGLPEPLVNVSLHGYRPDFYWPEAKLIVEFDGYGTHGSRTKFESDRRRDQAYAAHGILTIRATWLQLEREPVALVVRIGQALAVRIGQAPAAHAA